MHYELMLAICKWIVENRNEFQILNRATDEFRQYIFDDKGEYIIGGKQVSSFIIKQVKLMQEYSGEVKL